MAFYLLCLHLLVAAAVIKGNFLELVLKNVGPWRPPAEWADFSIETMLDQADQDREIPPGAVILLGDSIMAGVSTASVSPDAINFGLGGDTTVILRRRMATLRSIDTSRAVVIAVGVNDLRYRPISSIAGGYAEILRAIPPRVPVIATSVLPVDESNPFIARRWDLRNDAIVRLNTTIQMVCEQRQSCRFLNLWPVVRDGGSGRLDRALFTEDGWHLSAVGGDRIGAAIRLALSGL